MLFIVIPIETVNNTIIQAHSFFWYEEAGQKIVDTKKVIFSNRLLGNVLKFSFQKVANMSFLQEEESIEVNILIVVDIFIKFTDCFLDVLCDGQL